MEEVLRDNDGAQSAGFNQTKLELGANLDRLTSGNLRELSVSEQCGFSVNPARVRCLMPQLTVSHFLAIPQMDFPEIEIYLPWLSSPLLATNR